MGRLFWKIFFWYWIALFLVNIGQGWFIQFYYEQIYEKNEVLMRQQIKNIMVEFEQGNHENARKLLQASRRGNELPIYAVDKSGREYFGSSLPKTVYLALRDDPVDYRRVYKEEIALPGKDKVTLVGFNRSREERHTIVGMGLLITLTISTLVCYLLSRYLSFPIRQISRATHQIAEGHLDVRVGAIRRSDEMGDLARDFDRMADKIQHLLDSQKRLLQDISHELRSPLARLHVGFALLQRNKAKDKNADYHRITRDLDRLENLIGEVLTLSRFDTIIYSKERVELDKLVLKITENCSFEAMAKGVVIQVATAPGVVINGSCELLLRAIENVLRNAIKYTAESSNIYVNVINDTQTVAIQIIDEGPGIPESAKEDIFEAFVRLDPSRPHKPGGYGLGLAIAKKAIVLHGGTIAAVNSDRGGLTVTMTLPV